MDDIDGFTTDRQVKMCDSLFGDYILREVDYSDFMQIESFPMWQFITQTSLQSVAIHFLYVGKYLVFQTEIWLQMQATKSNTSNKE